MIINPTRILSSKFIDFVKRVGLMSCILVISSSMQPSNLQAQESLQVLKKKLFDSQRMGTHKKTISILEQMLTDGHFSKERYKKLVDLHFYLKDDEKALKIMKQMAEWANDAKTWELYSDLLLWKKKNAEGLEALKKSQSMDKSNETLYVKLANTLEYQGDVKRAEAIWRNLYKKKKKAMKIGESLTNFLLRNAKVNEALILLEELKKANNGFTSPQLQALYIKVLVWSGKSGNAFIELNNLDLKTLSEKEQDYFYNVDYFFTLALQGGNLDLANEIMRGQQQRGKDIWLKTIQISVVLGEPEYSRGLINDEIDSKGETLELLKLLYETYEAERDKEQMVSTIEKILARDYKNSIWLERLIKYYLLEQKYERGIDLFEDIIDEHDDADYIRFNLARLYLANGDYDDFEEILEQIHSEIFRIGVISLKIQLAALREDFPKLYELTVIYSKLFSKEAPEAQAGYQQKKENTPEYKEKERFWEEEEPQDIYVALLTELTALAERLGYIDNKEEHGRTLYVTLSARYKNFPTKKRLYGLILSGAKYATPVEHEKDILMAIKISRTPFFLTHYYRFLRSKKRLVEADVVYEEFKNMKKTLQDEKYFAEKTYKLVPTEFSKRLFQNVLLTDARYYNGLKQLGLIGVVSKNFDEAIRFFEQYIEVDPFDSEILFMLGEAHYTKRDNDLAVTYFQKTIDLLSGIDRSYSDNERLGLAYLRLEKYDKSIQSIKAGLKQNPKSKSLKLNMMTVLGSMARWQEMLDYIDEQNLEALEPLLAGLNTFVARNRLGELREAEIKIEKLNEKFPRNREVVSTLAYFLIQHGDDLKAKKYFEEAMKLPPINKEMVHDYKATRWMFADTLKMNLNLINSDTSENKLYSIENTVLVSDRDKVNIHVENFVGTPGSGSLSEISQNTYVLSYLGDPVGKREYTISLFKQKNIGTMFSYGDGKLDYYYQISLFKNRPDQDSYSYIAAETLQSGYSLEGSYQLTRLRQTYVLSLGDSTYNFIENQSILNKTIRKISELSISSVGGVVTQTLLKFPHSLELAISQQNKAVSNDTSLLFTNQQETSLKATFVKHWNKEILSEAQIGIGKEIENEKDLKLFRLKITYDNNPIQIVGEYQFQNESFTASATNTTTVSISGVMSF
ncbi:MAG: tetratricopeptide repeat protein [Proteobacteria bacterium]|nr:tetratricopeptide repeat protein [Pseudomonadota bacterium]